VKGVSYLVHSPCEFQSVAGECLLIIAQCDQSPLAWVVFRCRKAASWWPECGKCAQGAGKCAAHSLCSLAALFWRCSRLQACTSTAGECKRLQISPSSFVAARLAWRVDQLACSWALTSPETGETVFRLVGVDLLIASVGKWIPKVCNPHGEGEGSKIEMKIERRSISRNYLQRRGSTNKWHSFLLVLKFFPKKVLL